MFFTIFLTSSCNLVPFTSLVFLSLLMSATVLQIYSSYVNLTKNLQFFGQLQTDCWGKLLTL